MRRFLTAFALLAAACATLPDSASTEQAVQAPRELTLPLNARSLTNELQLRGITKKSDALALLPRAFKQRFALMKQTGALGAASPERPRVIHFEESGRFFLASSGHAEDGTHDSLEILEEDAITHEYRTHVISFDARGAALTEDDTRCTGCHGAPARPIWGSYPNWPGAYGERENEIPAEERPTFDAFVAMAKTDPDYRHLDIETSSQGFYLAVPYGHANTDVGEAVGIRWSVQLAARMAKSPRFESLKHAVVMASLYCNYARETDAFIDRLYASSTFEAEARYPARRSATKVYRLLGVEPTTDLRVEQTVISPPAVDYEIGMAPYDVGADYLTNHVAYPIFSDLVKADPTLEQLYASKLDAIRYADDITTKGDLATMLSLTDDSTPSYYDATHFAPYRYVHKPVLDDEGKRAQVCARLASAQLASQHTP